MKPRSQRNIRTSPDWQLIVSLILPGKNVITALNDICNCVEFGVLARNPSSEDMELSLEGIHRNINQGVLDTRSGMICTLTFGDPDIDTLHKMVLI